MGTAAEMAKHRGRSECLRMALNGQWGLLSSACVRLPGSRPQHHRQVGIKHPADSSRASARLQGGQVRRRAAIPLLVLLASTGCGTGTRASLAPGDASGTGGSTGSVTTTAAPTPTTAPSLRTDPATAPRIVVVSTGAASSGTGTTGIAVIRNGDPGVSAADVTVTFTAASSNGKAAVTAIAKLKFLSPAETQILTTPLPIPADDNIAAVTATAVSAAGTTYTNRLTTSLATFDTSTEFSPTVSVSVTNGGPASLDVTVAAACFDLSGDVVGGGSVTVVALGSSATQHLAVPLAVTDSPDHCSATARPA